MVFNNVSSTIQIALTFIGVLLIPGFAMSLALFPRFYDLDVTERLAMSIGLSLVIVIFIGMLLDFAGSLVSATGGIKASNILTSLSSTTMFFLLIWIIRRARTSKKNVRRQQI
ncbi:MAG TPA: DUF1616 domain-containing protein [Candidatus Acidoferrales bacterium]|nr:DUF1616 domain-containing protein [Candidatus Acidoferrales bacterium]